MRLVSWNIQGSRSTDLDRAAKALLDLEVDVIALQEVRRPQVRGLAKRLGELDWKWALKHRPLTRAVPWRAEGLAVLSRATIGASAWVELSEGASRSSHRRRIAVYADTSVDGTAVRVVNVHLATGEDQVRLAQVDRLLASEWLTGGPATVVLGDVNTEADLPALAAAGFAEDESAFQDTYPCHDPRRRIDRAFLASDGDLEFVEVDVPEGSSWVRLSDHRPLVVELAKRGQARAGLWE